MISGILIIIYLTIWIVITLKEFSWNYSRPNTTLVQATIALLRPLVCILIMMLYIGEMFDKKS
jgi:hypothetical protein